MGCGSAILAMAAQRLFPAADIFAVDNDPVSVRTAIENRRKNQISPAKMRAVVSEGFAARDISRNGPYDVILANILAGPLRRMAADLTSNLAPRGSLFCLGCWAVRPARSLVIIRPGKWCLTSAVIRVNGVVLSLASAAEAERDKKG